MTTRSARPIVAAVVCLPLLACATVYAVDVRPPGDDDPSFVGPTLVADDVAEVTWLSGDRAEVRVPLAAGDSIGQVWGCLFGADRTAPLPGFPVLEAESSPRGPRVIAFSLPRESLGAVASYNLVLLNGSLASTGQELQCPGPGDRTAQAYRFDIRTETQGRLLGAGAAGIAVVFVLLAGSAWW